jgi:hypothetical protein
VFKHLLLILLFICTGYTIGEASNISIFLDAEYSPFGAESFERQNNYWIYSKTGTYVGLSEEIVLFSDHVLNISQFADIGNNCFLGIAGRAELVIQQSLFITYDCTYREYIGTEHGYGYSTGTGYIHKLMFKMKIKLFEYGDNHEK